MKDVPGAANCNSRVLSIISFCNYILSNSAPEAPNCCSSKLQFDILSHHLPSPNQFQGVTKLTSTKNKTCAWLIRSTWNIKINTYIDEFHEQKIPLDSSSYWKWSKVENYYLTKCYIILHLKGQLRTTWSILVFKGVYNLILILDNR